MTISIANETYKGISNLTLTSTTTGLVMAWTKPMDFVLNTNNQMKEQMSRNQFGEMARVGSYPSQSTPEIQINYSVLQPELFAFSQGVYLISGTYATHLPKFIDTVSQAEYPAVVGVGLLGTGIVANAVSNASVYRDGISVALVQQPAYATFTPATADSFAVGADGALKFSDNLVTSRESVALSIPYPGLVGSKLSGLVTNSFRLDATLVSSRNRVTFFTAYEVSPNINGANLQPGTDSFGINLYCNQPSDRCRAWEILETQKFVAC